MKRTAVDVLIDTLSADKPAILFLGQDYVRGSENTDFVLKAFVDRRKASGKTSPKWRDVFNNEPITDHEFEWLGERFDRSVESERMERVWECAWSAIFTSSIDQKIIQRLETRGRVPEPVLAKDHFSRASRSKVRPAVHFLFGRASDFSGENKPPRSLQELKRRFAMHSAPILNRLTDTATPLGIIVIDGYDDTSDWLELDQLLAPISHKAGPKVLWFGSPKRYPESIFFSQMEEDGILLREDRSLADALFEAEIPAELSETIFHINSGTISLSNGKFLLLQASLRLRTEAVAAVVDDTWIDPTSVHKEVSIDEAFRRFHGDIGGPRALVEGVGKGYAIERDFEEHLLSATVSLLEKGVEREGYLVLHGQSGVGKSIALARLARLLRTRFKVPVLYSWGRVPSAIELNDFCEEAERAGAVGTVIICDCSQPFERYRDLAIGLKSRGRRVIVVGTSYRIEEPRLRTDERFIDAPEFLSPREISKLREILSNFSGQEVSELDIKRQGEHFLALLYRHLSISRTHLAHGVASEARFAEGVIRLRARAVPRNSQEPTLLAQKLIEAGLTDNPITIFDDDENDAVNGADAAAKLVDLVMVAGRLDCAVPINLAIRAVRAEDEQFDSTQIGYLFGELDLFRWRVADTEGCCFMIQPRLQLEAELICRRRMGDFKRELECLLALIGAVRSSSIDEKSEIQFLLDLLHKLHRDGPRKLAYRAGYLVIARALTTLRERHQVIDAGVMLQESAFRREAVFAAGKPNEVDETISDAERDKILDEAREVIELALNSISKGELRAGKRARKNFAVERASIYGYLAVGSARRNAPEELVWSQYLAARTAIAQAMSSTGNYFSLDIGLWAPADIAQAFALSDVHKAEIQADMLALIDRGRTDVLPPMDAERFRVRQFKVAPIIERTDLANEAFAHLEKINAPVAYFLKAREMCMGIFDNGNEAISELDHTNAASASNFLEQRRAIFETDTRCLQLLLQLKWISITGTRLFSGERTPIPREESKQDELLNIVSALNLAAGEGGQNIYRLLEASLEWMRGDVTHAKELFRSLAHDSEFEDSTRVARRFLLKAENDQGFRGLVERERSEGHWILRVEGHSGTVDLLSRDFHHDDLRPGRELRNFNIAFNFLGPIADPLVKKGERK